TGGEKRVQGDTMESDERALRDDRAKSLYQRLTDGQDTHEVRSAVDRHQSGLRMPTWQIRGTQVGYGIIRRWDLYDLAEEAKVSTQNLVVRLQRLKLIFIP